MTDQGAVGVSLGIVSAVAILGAAALSWRVRANQLRRETASNAYGTMMLLLVPCILVAVVFLAPAIGVPILKFHDYIAVFAGGWFISCAWGALMAHYSRRVFGLK